MSTKRTNEMRIQKILQTNTLKEGWVDFEEELLLFLLFPPNLTMAILLNLSFADELEKDKMGDCVDVGKELEDPNSPKLPRQQQKES